MEAYYDADGGYGCDGGAPAATVTGGGGDGVYSGAAAVGRVVTTIGAVVACLIALVLIIIAVTQLASKRTGKAQATVTSAVKQGTTTNVNNGEVQTQYLLTLSFVNSATKQPASAKGIVYSSSGAVATGDKLDVFYDPKNPQDLVIGSVSPQAMGGILLGVGAVVAGLGVGVAVLSRKSKAFAAFEGVAGTINMARGL